MPGDSADGAARNGAAREALDAGLIAGISHDLKTPLAVLLGYAELLQHRGDEATRLEAADLIAQATVRISAGLEHLVAALALASETLQTDPVSVPLRELVEDALAPRLGERLRLEAGSWPTVRGDPEQLAHALRALAAHLLDGQESVLSASACRDGDGAELVLATVVEAGVRTTSAGSFGAGGHSMSLLELHVARGLVEGGGGTVRPERSASGSQAFRLSLPVAGP